ncbi:MAG: ATP-grasp domain-containing protein [Myxococcales bacterium]|nr:ATP-grasp domain-containing protein [Myxococcales bacterium]
MSHGRSGAMRWILEPGVFGAGAPPLAEAAVRAGHQVIAWRDDLSRSLEHGEQLAQELDDQAPVMFHGSLELAATMAASPRWRPGAFCDVASLRHGAWAEQAQPYLANPRYLMTTVGQLVADPEGIAGELAMDGRIFVRPESPLKPFSGRVVALRGLRAADLDHGFYYEDLELPIVVAPVQSLGQEWRLVMAGGRVVAASAYRAEGRRSLADAVPAEAVALAEQLAAVISTADPVVVVDLVATASGLRLLELNPFSGADLYACSPDAVVAAVARACRA